MQTSDVHGKKWGEAELYTYLYNAYLIYLSSLFFRMISLFQTNSININLLTDPMIWVFKQALWRRIYTLSTLDYISITSYTLIYIHTLYSSKKVL